MYICTFNTDVRLIRERKSSRFLSNFRYLVVIIQIIKRVIAIVIVT